MKKLDLGQTISILANLGVIAGIVFLAYEVNQNNEFLAEQARYSMLQNQITVLDNIGSNPDVARLLYLPDKDVPLTDLDRGRRKDLLIALRRRWEWDSQRSAMGLTTMPPVATFQARYRENHLELDWSSLKPRFSPEFVQWMEENIVDER